MGAGALRVVICPGACLTFEEALEEDIKRQARAEENARIEKEEKRKEVALEAKKTPLEKLWSRVVVEADYGLDYDYELPTPTELFERCHECLDGSCHACLTYEVVKRVLDRERSIKK